MNRIRIFLASSSELKEDREQFELRIGRMNQVHQHKGFFLDLVVWENFLDVMSDTRLQHEYNKEITNVDIFVTLFFTKAGKFTDEEFETAFNHFTMHGKPLIFTFFKNAAVYTGDLIEEDLLSLFKFKKKLDSLGHFPTYYTSIEDLKLKFSDQIGKLIDSGRLENSSLPIKPDLEKILVEERIFCKQHNIYVYAANLLRALLKNKEGALSSCLHKVKRGYPELLALKLATMISEVFINSHRAKEFIEEDWFKRQDFITAAKIAKNANAVLLDERQLVLGIIAQDGNTIGMIKNDLGTTLWDAFIKCIQQNGSSDFDSPVFQMPNPGI